jgi:hypothetical protein
MLEVDHLTIPVTNWIVSRDWYVNALGLKVEFEVPSRLTAAVQDQHDFTIFLVQALLPSNTANFALTFQVDAEVCVSATHPKTCIGDMERSCAIRTGTQSVCGMRSL